ncbi:MAG TPA: hypothetical protein DCS28_03775 [Candidatus Moranbacteria bacterium]|nr:hypothetical protein [Candidatus Moranbacteria bacterium]HAT75130.1 hypothetical protein [Candidatus Moranbacteria bacterium]
MSQEYKNNLNQERSSNQPRNKLSSDNNKRAAASQAFSLIGFIEIIDIFFIVAIMTAVLKDVLDFLAVGSIPVIGTALTFMASITIIAAMFICGSRSSSKSKGKKITEKIAKKWGTLAGGTIFEMLFGLNFIPVETITAFVIYIFILQERKEAAEERQQEREMAGMTGGYA